MFDSLFVVVTDDRFDGYVNCWLALRLALGLLLGYDWFVATGFS